MNRATPATVGQRAGMRLGDRTDTFLLLALALVVLLALADWLRSGVPSYALLWIALGPMFAAPPIFTLTYLPALAVAALTGWPDRRGWPRRGGSCDPFSLLGMTRAEFALAVAAWGVACIALFVAMSAMTGGRCGTVPGECMLFMLLPLPPLAVAVVLTALACRAALRRIFMAPASRCPAGVEVETGAAASATGCMRFGDRIFDVATTCAVPVLVFLLWDLVRAEHLPLKLRLLPPRVLYLMLLLFPLAYLTPLLLALATGRPGRTPWRWRRSVPPPGGQRPLRRPMAALVLLGLGLALWLTTLPNLPDVQGHFRIYLQDCTPELQDLGRQEVCNPVPAPELREHFGAGMLIGAWFIGLLLIGRMTALGAWRLLRRLPGIR